jgi:hypothetical protein
LGHNLRKSVGGVVNQMIKFHKELKKIGRMQN